uniref:Gypsy retrotransposon integrase-like protein 1 n=1 Tax=Cyprinus carpio carpio TaxID=630221 RepID=A0A9J8C322_CYPCA
MQTPSGTPGSPFAEIITSLAGLHQENHQALLDLRADQEQRFQAMMRVQQEDRELFRSLLDREVRMRSASPSPIPAAHMPLTKMGASDDPEAFLDLFERTAEACEWPSTSWPVRLIPLLSGEAQKAAQQLPVQNLLVYADLKRAILQRAASVQSSTANASGRWSWRKRADPLSWHSSSGTRAANGCWLEEATPRPSLTRWYWNSSSPDYQREQPSGSSATGRRRWIWPSNWRRTSWRRAPGTRFAGPPRAAPRWRTGTEAAAGSRGPTRGVGLPQLEGTDEAPTASPRQSFDPLPATRAAGRPGPACWRCGDPGHFVDRCPVMEVGTLVRIPDDPQAAPDQAGLYQIPVSIKGGTYRALVDSGCNQTSIHQSLIQSGALDTGRMVKVRCVHGDIVEYPVKAISIKFRGQKHCVEVAVSPRLRHPLILGTNWPAFEQLLGCLTAGVSGEKRRQVAGASAQVGETVPGPSGAGSGEPSSLARLTLSSHDDFPLEQSHDETLKHAFEQVRSIDGQILQPDRTLSYPYFAIIKDRLYRVTQDTQTKEDTTQLLVPRSRREMLFQAAHCNPMAGHLGVTATLNRLMTRFFWPGIHENVRRWCASCRECQLVNPPAAPKAPLRPLPLVQVPFERIGMDLIGPLERSARGHRFALVIVDYATRYPEAVALRNISAKSVADALFRLISRVGIPKEILTDQGTAFMSRTLNELYAIIGH